MMEDRTVYATFTHICDVIRGDFHPNVGRIRHHTWRIVQNFCSRGNRNIAYVGQLGTDDPKVWRVVRWRTDEVLDIAFPTRDAAIVYAVMLTGGAR